MTSKAESSFVSYSVIREMEKTLHKSYLLQLFETQELGKTCFIIIHSYDQRQWIEIVDPETNVTKHLGLNNTLSCFLSGQNEKDTNIQILTRVGPEVRPCLVTIDKKDLKIKVFVNPGFDFAKNYQVLLNSNVVLLTLENDNDPDCNHRQWTVYDLDKFRYPESASAQAKLGQIQLMNGSVYGDEKRLVYFDKNSSAVIMSFAEE